jgi:hypothetical protein
MVTHFRKFLQDFSHCPHKKIYNVSEETSSFLRYTVKIPKIHRLALTYNTQQINRERYQA